jgi:23S rRNA (uracil1939-C5)-methyltransferase
LNLTKNEIYKIEITDITSEGQGVGKIDNFVIFTPFTAVGDICDVKIVQAKKTYAYGIVKSIKRPSSARISSDCAYFEKCGGCAYRHITYEEELRIKEKIFFDALQKIGKIDLSEVEKEPIIGSEKIDRYRNKVQLPVENNEFGFYAPRSHRLVPVKNCRLQPEIFEEIAKFVAENSPLDIGLRNIFIRRGYHSGEISLCLITKSSHNLKDFANDIISRFKDIKQVVQNINPENTNGILSRKFVLSAGSETITDCMCGNKIKLHPSVFYQVNTPSAEKLYSIAKSFADPKETDIVFDLYCGVGTIGLYFAKFCNQVFGIETVAKSIELAKENAALNEIENCEFICGDSLDIFKNEKLTLGSAQGEVLNIKPNIIITDPPRKGCSEEVLQNMVKSDPGKIVMLSCNPSTLARDCRYLTENGYRVKKIGSVDMFPRTVHIECVVLLEKNQTVI